jgi:hypothetical protein
VSAPAAEGGSIQNFIRSLYSKSFYQSAPRLGVSAGFRNLLLMALVLGLATSTQWSSAAGRAVREWRIRVEEGSMPALRVEGGRLSVRGPQPYLRHEANGSMVIVDTTGTYSGLPDSVATGLFVGRDAIVFKSSPEVSRAYSFKGQSFPLWLDGPGLRTLSRLAVPAVLLVGMPPAFLYYLAVNLILSLVLSGFVVLLVRAFRLSAALRYREVLTVAFFVMTPVSILFKFTGLVAPGLSIKMLPFYPALATSLLLAAVRVTGVPPRSLGV